MLCLFSMFLLFVGILVLIRPYKIQAWLLGYHGWWSRIAQLFPGFNLTKTRFFTWELRVFGIVCLAFSILVMANLLGTLL